MITPGTGAAVVSPLAPPGVDRTAAAGRKAVSFFDFLSAMNPLQYIPVVGTIYRAITGDVVPEALRDAGSMLISGLLGGPIGLLTNIVVTIGEKISGIDPERIAAAILHPASPAAIVPSEAAVAVAVRAPRGFEPRGARRVWRAIGRVGRFVAWQRYGSRCPEYDRAGAAGPDLGRLCREANRAACRSRRFIGIGALRVHPRVVGTNPGWVQPGVCIIVSGRTFAARAQPHKMLAGSLISVIPVIAIVVCRGVRDPWSSWLWPTLLPALSASLLERCS